MKNHFKIMVWEGFMGSFCDEKKSEDVMHMYWSTKCSIMIICNEWSVRVTL